MALPRPEPVPGADPAGTTADSHETMEKLATADDVAAAVRAAGRRVRPADPPPLTQAVQDRQLDLTQPGRVGDQLVPGDPSPVYGNRDDQQEPAVRGHDRADGPR